MQAVERTFAILAHISRHPQGIGVTRLSEAIDLPKATISRFLVALEAEGMVSRSAENAFTLGENLYALTQPRTERDDLVDTAAPFLMGLNQTTGEAVTLSVLENQTVTYVAHFDSVHALQVVDWVGESLPPHGYATGKLLLAFADPALLDQYLETPLHPITEKTIIDPAEFRAELDRICAQGFAVTDEEYADDVIGYAVPIRNSADEVIASIGLYGPKFRFAELGSPAEIVDRLWAAAAQIKAALA